LVEGAGATFSFEVDGNRMLEARFTPQPYFIMAIQDLPSWP